MFPSLAPIVILASTLLPPSALNFTAEQQKSPAVSQEEVLRNRVEQFYAQLTLGKIASAQQYVTPATRDNFLNQPGMVAAVSFEVSSIKLDGNTPPKQAEVTVKRDTINPPSTTPVPVFTKSTWVLEDGVWMIEAPAPTPMPTAQDLFDHSKGVKPPAPREEIKFDNTTADMGKMEVGEKRTAKFTFKNISDHTVSIEATNPCEECGHVIKGLKKEYKPGETGELDFVYDSSRYLDDYYQTLVVKTKPGGARTNLLVTGVVNRPQPKEAKQ